MFFRDMPFDDAHFGGGARMRKEIDNKMLYDVLGVDQKATPDEIRRAYRILAKKHHPDKGGDTEEFKKISKANEILSDPEKRKLYDQYGEEGVDNGGGADGESMFDVIFGGGRQRRQGKRKGEDVVSKLSCTLEQLYIGVTRKLAVNRQIVCTGCDGRGGPADSIMKCDNCDGRGVKMRVQQVGPMIQTMQMPCNKCKSKGEILNEAKRCKMCRGNGTCQEKKLLNVYVDPGAPNHHKIVFSGEADQKPDEIPGDVVFVVDEQPHNDFKRKNDDLFMEKNISLFEALVGFEFVVTHLDGRKILIRSDPNRVTKPQDVLGVKEEGMPNLKNRFQKGHLFILFNVVFPTNDQMTDKCKKTLMTVLPLPAKTVYNENEVEHCLLEELKPTEKNQGGRRQEAYEDDEEDEGGVGGGRRVQCRQQ